MNLRGPLLQTAALRNKLLVVEDDQRFRQLLQDYFSDRGFVVNTAATGAEALWSLSREKPDLIILDLMMPEMSGEHVCRLIKSDAALTDIIVFILTAKDDLKTKLDCFNMGAEEFLVKPIEMEELAVRIKRFLAFTDRYKTASPSEERTMTIDIGKEPRTDRELPAKVSVAMRRRQHSEKSRYGSYRVERLVGKGGMGEVYKAYDDQLDRFVALKVLAKQWTDSVEFVARFRREAKLIAAITHPGIAQIYSLGEDQGEYYFALLWCPGGSLRDLIRNQHTIGFMKAVDIMLQCTRALAAAWQKGVVHRDVKPSNIMFDENQQIKIVDFGIAHIEKTSAQITVAQEILGSPAYMAPEQGRAEKVDHRTDIYALGMTFFQLLSGDLPFSAKSPVEWMIKHATEPFPAYKKVERKIPQKAYRIIEKMTKKKSSDRYESYAELITDLENVQTELFRERQFKVPSATRVAKVTSVQGDQLFEILVEIAKGDQSGILETRWGPLGKKFLILHGDVILFESPQSEENVWNKLIERGILGAEQVALPNPPLEETLNHLLFLQALTLDEFTTCYRQLMKSALLEVFRWPTVEIEFRKAEITQDSFCKFPLTTLVMEGVRKYMDYESIRLRVPRDRFIVRTPQFNRILSRVELPATESFLASRIEGESVTLEILQMLTGFPLEHIARFIYALKGFGAIEYRSTERKKQRHHDQQPPDSPSDLTPTPAHPKRVSHAAESYYKLAEQAYAKNDFWITERLCTEALDLNPEEAKYHHLAALAISHRSESGKMAEEYFRKAIELDPFNSLYRLDLANFFRGCGLIGTAIDECRQAMKIDPQNRNVASLLHSLEKLQPES